MEGVRAMRTPCGSLPRDEGFQAALPNAGRYT
jgi:hypothetical protein